MATDAQKRAKSKYEKEKVKAFNLRFYPADSELYEHLAKQPNKAGYLKDLIRKDMDSRCKDGGQ